VSSLNPGGPHTAHGRKEKSGCCSPWLIQVLAISASKMGCCDGVSRHSSPNWGVLKEKMVSRKIGYSYATRANAGKAAIFEQQPNGQKMSKAMIQASVTKDLGEEASSNSCCNKAKSLQTKVAVHDTCLLYHSRVEIGSIRKRAAIALDLYSGMVVMCFVVFM
jgi:hypothetical protein